MKTSEVLFLRLHPSPENAESLTPTIEAGKSFFSAMLGLLKQNPEQTLSVELIHRDGAISFILAIPSDWRDIIQQQLYTAFPHATVEIMEYWSTFNRDGEVAGASLSVTPKIASFPYVTQGEGSIICSLLEILSGLDSSTGVAIQFLLQTAKEKKTFITSLSSEVGGGMAKAFHQFLIGNRNGDDPNEDESNEKLIDRCFRANINIIALDPSYDKAKDIVDHVTVALHKMCVGSDGKLGIFNPNTKEKRAWLAKIVERKIERKRMFYLSDEEMSHLYIIPSNPITFPKLVALRSTHLPPPSNMAKHGLFVGISSYRNRYQPVYLAPEDRLRHVYLIGQTGTGKSTLFQSAILQDITNGEGCCFIDPHGEAIDWLLPRIPKHRAEDVLLFDPADDESLLGLNLLEWRTPQERDLLIQELIYLFYKLFDPQRTGIIGPQFEHWLRNAALTVTEPKIRGTLVDIPRLFTDQTYLQTVLPLVEHTAVLDFWHNQMTQTADFHKSEMLNYFTSKFGSFLGNSCMYRILSQRQSAFDMRLLMDRKKILLVNLSKGKLGSQNAELLGTIFMTKLQMAALGRSNVPQAERTPFYVYIDEFQNIATDSFSTMLSEIRKYGVALNLAHQYVDQLPLPVKQAVVGNVGTIMAFRLGQNDADWLTPHFTPLSHNDLTNIQPYHFHIRPLMFGTLASPFTIRSLPIEVAPSEDVASSIRQRVRHFVLAYAETMNALHI